MAAPRRVGALLAGRERERERERESGGNHRVAATSCGGLRLISVVVDWWVPPFSFLFLFFFHYFLCGKRSEGDGRECRCRCRTGTKTATVGLPASGVGAMLDGERVWLVECLIWACAVCAGAGTAINGVDWINGSSYINIVLFILLVTLTHWLSKNLN
jgi:hypothetical protein